MVRTESLSVVMPARDAAATISAAVQDVLRGLEPDDEVVVVDDGSTDDTPGLLAGLAAADRRLRVVTTSGIGLVRALNLGLQEATHGWIARADADDRYPTGRFAAQRHKATGGVALVTGDYRMVAEGGVIGRIPCALTPPFVAASLVHPQRVPHPGVLFHRDAVQEAGGYQEQDFPAEDLALWLRLSRVGQFVGVPQVVVDWSMRAGSVTHSRQQAQREKTAELLRQWSLPAAVRELSRRDVECELEAICGTADADERRLLLVRDLRDLIPQGVGRDPLRIAMRALGRNPVGTARAAVQLMREQRRRSRMRGGFGPTTG